MLLDRLTRESKVFFIEKCVQSSMRRNFIINRTRDCQKRLCNTRSISQYADQCSPVLNSAILAFNNFQNCNNCESIASLGMLL